jgi:hypothetical protein
MDPNIIIPGLLIIIHRFPLKPSHSLQNKYITFWTNLLSICRHNPQAPKWLQLLGQKPILQAVFHSRRQLQEWFLDISKHAPWVGINEFASEPRHWGPFMWSLIHGVSLMVRPHDTQTFGEWIRLIPFVLPCKDCAASFTHILGEIRGVRKPHDAVLLGLQLHRAVNKEVHGSRPLSVPDITPSTGWGPVVEKLLNTRQINKIAIPVIIPKPKKKYIPILTRKTKTPPPKKKQGCGCGGG